MKIIHGGSFTNAICGGKEGAFNIIYTINYNVFLEIPDLK